MNRKYKKYSRDRKFMENLIDVYNYIRAAADIKALSAYSFLHYERLRHNDLRSCFEFLQKVFLGLMYPFSCVLWAIFWSFSLAIFLITEAKMPQKLIPNHRTINSKQLLSSVRIMNNRVERLLFRELENGICITIIELNTTHYGNKK